MKYALKRYHAKSFLISRDNIVIEVNDEFINLSGFSRDKFIGKSLKEISRMIKIDSQIFLENIQNMHRCYMFTEKNEMRDITIYCKSAEYENEKVYLIREKPNTRIENIIPYAINLLSDNKISTSIYSKDGVLIRANQKYIDFLVKTCNKTEDIISKNIIDIYTEDKSRDIYKCFLSTIANGEAICSKEVKYQYCEKEIAYFDISLVPISISGKIKYVFHSITDVTENVVNRTLAQQQKQELEVIIKNISDGLFIVDKNYEYTLLNSAAREIFYNPDSIKKVGDTAKHTLYYDSEGRALEVEKYLSYRVLRGEVIKNARIRLHRPDGIFYFSFSGNPLYDKDGNVEKAIFCARDITAQVNNDELIKQQKEQLEAIIENMSDGLAIFNKNGEITNINKVGRESFFPDPDSLKVLFNQDELFEVDGNVISTENSLIPTILNGEKLSGYRLDMKINGSIHNTEINCMPISDQNGELVAGVVLVRDITDRVKNQEAELIKAQYDLLNNMIENLEVGLIRYSYPDLHALDINNKIFSFIEDINPKYSFSDLFHIIPKEDRAKLYRVLYSLVKKNGGSYIYSFKNASNLQEIFLKLIIQPMFGLNNKVVEVIVIVIDITEEVKAKNKLEENLKMQDEIYLNISHELKTPLNVIFATNQLMELYLKDDSIELHRNKIIQSIGRIKQNCYRLTKLINNIVDLSKIDSGFLKLHMINENIVAIVENIVQSVSEYIKGRDLSIIFDTNIEEKIIACDPDKLERIMLNLISNAIKFSDLNSKIYVSFRDKGDFVEISVKDTGVGIEKRHLDSIFQRFQQVDKTLARNSEGSGIGLSLVKSMVDLLGGTISVESEIGKGSDFKIQLPANTLKETEKDESKEIQVSNKIEMINIEFSDIYNLQK